MNICGIELSPVIHGKSDFFGDIIMLCIYVTLKKAKEFFLYNKTPATFFSNHGKR